MSRPRSIACIAICILTIISGILLLVAGSIFINEINYIHDYWNDIYSLSIFSICIGGITIIFSIMLIYVVCKQFPALTTLFSGLLIFAAFAGVICGVLLIVGRSNIIGTSYKNSIEIFGNYSQSNILPNTNKIVSKIQRNFRCCGVEKATYWEYKYPDNTSVPDTCCIQTKINCGQGALKKQDEIYLRGCNEPLYIYLQHKYTILIIFNFINVALTLASAILGIVFERYIRQQYQIV